MTLLTFQVLFYAISLFVFGVALDDDYDDDDSATLLTDPRYDTDTNANETYSALSARLNCSNLVISHKGVKIEEILSDSIYKPTEAPITVIIPVEDTYNLTLSDISTEGHENFTEHHPQLYEYRDDNIQINFTEHPQLYEYRDDNIQINLTEHHPQLYEYKDDIIQINLTDNSLLYDYIEFPSHTESTEENSTEIPELNKNGPLHNLLTSAKKTSARAHPIENASKLQHDAEPDCTFAFQDSGGRFNWYQIISQSGGIPGEVNATRLTPKVTEILEPCHRPVHNTTPPLEDLLYEYESIEYKKFYRRERAFLRFAGTASEFVDIIGQLVWAPPKQDLRFYRLSYRKDDTGFYVNVRERHKCVFKEDPLSVDCYLVEDFLPCPAWATRTLSVGLEAALLG